MEKYLLIMPFLFFLFLPIVRGIDFNTTVNTLDVETALNNVTWLKAQYGNGSWFVNYGYGSTPAYLGLYTFTALFDDNFNRIYGFTGKVVQSNEDSFRGVDYQVGFQNNQSNIYYRYETFSGGNRYVKEQNATTSDLTFGSAINLESEAGVQRNEYEFAMTSSWNWVQLTDRMAHIRGYNASWVYYIDASTKGALTIPSGLKIGNASLFYEPVYQNYIVIGENVSGNGIFAIFYDTSFGYEDYQTLTLSSGTNPKIDEIQGTVFITFKFNQTAIAIFTYAPSTYQSCTGLGLICTTKPRLNLVNRQYVDLNISNAITSHQSVETPHLAYFYSKFLFYSIRNNTAGATSGIYYLKETVPCSCTAWEPVYVNGYKKCHESNAELKRSCYPRSCLDEYNYTFDTWCNDTVGGLYPELARDYKYETNCQPCQTGWKKANDYSTASCSASVKIPSNATNITSNATWHTEVTGFLWDPTRNMQGKYFNVILCNPITDCFSQNYSCQQTNITITKDYPSYSAGTTVKAEFGISGASSCKQIRMLGIDFGWNQYNVYGDFCVNYDIPCGRRVCVKEGLNEYWTVENPDCSLQPINETNLCENGCEDGVCKPAISKDILTGDPLTIVQNLAESSFSSSILFGFSVFTSVGASLYSYVYIKDSKLPIISFLALILFFTYLTWVPVWVGIVIILGIVLLMSKSLWLKD